MDERPPTRGSKELPTSSVGVEVQDGKRQEASQEPAAVDIEPQTHGGDDASGTDEKETQITGWALYTLIAALLLVVFIITLDISILATAIPRITDEFHTIADIGWYGSSFMITNCALQPFAGRIYTIFPFKSSFLTFLTIFEIGSLLCGVSVSSAMLVISRAVCGIGSSGLMNGSMTIVGIAAPPSKRGLMMGIFMSLASIGQVVGPLIGGSLTQYVTWRWCFYLNLPVGGAAILVILFSKMPTNPKQGGIPPFKNLFHELDIVGLLIFAPACVMLLIGLEWGGTEYAWNSPTVLGLLCGSVVAFVLFAFWERRHGDSAMIPTAIVNLRPVYSSLLTAGSQGAAMLILTYYLALWFQTIKEDSPTISAVSTIPNFISQVLTAVVSSFLWNKIGYVLPSLILGNALVTTSYGLLSTLQPTSGTGLWIGYQILAGAGRGMSLQGPMLAGQASVPITGMATVTALVAWAQFLGGAVFLSLGQTVFQNLLRQALPVYAPGVDVAAVLAAGATGFTLVVPQDEISAVRLAYNEAITHTFYLGVGVAATSTFVCLLIGKTRVMNMKEMMAARARGQRTSEK